MSYKTILIAIDEFASASNISIEILESAGFKLLFNETGGYLDYTKNSDLFEEADYIIAGVEPYTEEFFQKFKNIKAISRVGVGVDSIDVISANQYGVKIFITSDKPSVAVAELCISNMISLLRHTLKMSNELKLNHWNPIQGRELRSCTVGIIGLGSIGKELIKRLNVFGSKIIGYGRSWNAEFANKFNVDRKSIQEVFEESDIITIHLPLTSETKGLINKDIIKLAKNNALILNTSRAGVVDNDALVNAISVKNIKAAIDVFDEERDPYPYAEIEDVILTPHIASHTFETRKSMEEMASKTLVIFDSITNKDTSENIDEKLSYISKHSVK
jgi:D-3-phosphoglycerate dehydrogenase / 2-oxoglutarate reductase